MTLNLAAVVAASAALPSSWPCVFVDFEVVSVIDNLDLPFEESSF